MKTLWEDDQHKFVWLGASEQAIEKGIASNQYLIVDGEEGYLLDPGGYHVFARVFEAVVAHVKPDRIRGIFLSHQDPDTCASLVSWLEVAPEVTVWISKLWERFIPHLALPVEPKLRPIPDQGETLVLPSGSELRFIPAHYLHSPGNFMAYDERSKILFSGDVGGAVASATVEDLFVADFEAHVERMEGFHRRYVPCKKAIDNTLAHLGGLTIDMIAPQHGLLFRDEMVGKFVQWISALDVGVDYKDWGVGG